MRESRVTPVHHDHPQVRVSAGLVREPVSEQGLRPEVCVSNIIPSYLMSLSLQM